MAQSRGITCGLLWCFYQQFELSFWRHPFTQQDQLVSILNFYLFREYKEIKDALMKYVMFKSSI